MIIVNVKKRFSGLEMDAAWRAGREVTVLFGPSGSGKTTLLRMIAGLEQPDEGKITVGGRILFDEKINLKPEVRQVGLVFQEHALFPWLSVEQNIFFGLSHHERRAGNEWTRTLVDIFGIGALLGKQPAHLSGGEVQRVALARALFVTHDLTEAHLIGDHLVRLDAGRVSYEGPIDGLVQNSSTEFMAAY